MILVTGPIGAGKTTLCARAADAAVQRGEMVAGVLTPALIQDGAKVGIRAQDLASGESRLLAHTARNLGGVSVGPYSFDDRVLSWVVSNCARGLAGRGLVFVDEMGRLELEQGRGLAPLLPLLARPRPATTVVIVRQGLLDRLTARLAAAEPVVVHLDPLCRDAAWSALIDLVFTRARSTSRTCAEGK